MSPTRGNDEDSRRRRNVVIGVELFCFDLRNHLALEHLSQGTGRRE